MRHARSGIPETALPGAGSTSTIHPLFEVETIIGGILAIQCMPRDRRMAALKILEDCCQRDTPQAHPHLPLASFATMGVRMDAPG
jgi:hypothetical protein